MTLMVMMQKVTLVVDIDLGIDLDLDLDEVEHPDPENAEIKKRGRPLPSQPPSQRLQSNKCTDRPKAET